MRKTCPVPLPDEQLNKTLLRHSPHTPHFHIDTLAPSRNGRSQPHSPSSSSSTTLFVDDDISFDGFTDTTSQMSDTLPLVGSMETTDTSQQVPMPQFSTMPAINKTNDIVAETNDRCTINLQDNEPVVQNQQHQTRSLGDEYLIALTQQLSSDETDTTLIENSNLNFYNGDSVLQQNRPRQMGRRAEGRVRVVSITTETNALGNQVCVTIISLIYKSNNTFKRFA